MRLKATEATPRSLKSLSSPEEKTDETNNNTRLDNMVDWYKEQKSNV